jgi:hypothetical protein
MTNVGIHSRRKGRAGEQEVVRLARTHGLDAERCWENAQHPDYPRVRQCDVVVDGKTAQVKVSADGFGALYDGLDGVELLLVRADRRPWLAVLPASHLFDLLKRASQGTAV